MTKIGQLAGMTHIKLDN